MNTLDVVPLLTALQTVPTEFKMAETWDADKKYHVAMAIMTGIMRNNRPHMSWLNFEWQEIADMLNKAKNYGLTADAVR